MSNRQTQQFRTNQKQPYRGWWARFQAEESGQSLVILSLSMFIIIGMLGIVLDLGYSTVMHRRMQFAADAAALAGARDLAHGESESTATQRMAEVLEANAANPALSTYTVVDGSGTDVWARASVPALFSGLFGIDAIEVEAHANAAFGRLSESGNLMPFVVEEDQWVLNQPVVLWGERNGPGNFGWVRWSGQNPSTPTLEYNIDNPSQSDMVAIGGQVSGHPGVSFNPVQDNLNAWIGKKITVILYDSVEVQGNGNNLTYTVRGFANFIITGTYSHGNHSEIYGAFAEYVTVAGVINPGVTGGAMGISLLQ